MHRGSGLQPRQLDLDELATQDRSARKRAADQLEHQDGPSTIQNPAGAGEQATNTKKQRSSILRTNPSPLSMVEVVEDEPVQKPDVFEYLAQRANRNKDLENQIEDLKSKERTLTHKLALADSQATEFKADATAAEARYRALEEQLEIANNRLRTEARRAENALADLAAANRRVAAQPGTSNLATTTAAQLNGTPGGNNSIESQQEARELRLRISELELQLQTQEHEARDASSKAQAEVREERRRREAATATAELLQQQAEEALAASEQDAKARREAEARCADLERSTAALIAGGKKSSTTAGAQQSKDDEAVLIRTLRERLAVAEATAAEAHKLKQQAVNAHVLNERLQAAESRAKRAEQLAEDAELAATKLHTAEEALRRWEVVLGGAADCTTPEQVLHLLNKLQADQLSAKASLGELNGAQTALKAELAAAVERIQEAKKEQEVHKVASEEAAVALARSERKAELLVKERDGLKAMLDSYDQEYLVHGGDPNAPQQQRITQLEATIQSLHTHITSLEQDLATATTTTTANTTTTTTTEAVAAATARAEALKAKLKRTEGEATALSQEVARLQARVGRGEFDPERTQVLHLRMNPEAQARKAAMEERLEQLQSENDALRENIARLETAINGSGTNDDDDNDEGGGGTTRKPRAAIDAGLKVAQLESELNLMRRKVAETRKASDRLQQVFTKQIALLREALVGLFGYRVDMNVDPSSKEQKAQVLLRPQHADEPGAELSFAMLRDGRLVLLPNEYTRRKLKVEVETFIERFKSIPAFTANLTMELFQRQTQG